jgi:hypothetical protein
MVDDGSTDDSAQLLADWATRRPDTVRILTQDNAGQGAARNAGIAAASGQWISFPDPDDALAPDYLAVVAAFLDTHPDADLVATHRLMWNETTGRLSDSHPLRSMFRGSPYTDLGSNPELFHGSSPTSFFRLDRIRTMGLEFDSRIRPNFEDGHFNCCYLLSSPRPHIGFLDRAKYHYRQRADGTSTVQTSRSDERRYSAVPEFGYLDVVRRARAQHGSVPGWLSSYLAYELTWYFNKTDSAAGEGRPIDGSVADRFHELIGDLLAYVDIPDALPYAPPSQPVTPGLVMAHGYRAEPWHDPFIQLGNLDVTQELVRASYFFTGDLPAEAWRGNGELITPLHAKVRDLTYYGRTLLRERIAWLPADRTLQIDLNGAPVDIVYDRPYGPLRVAPSGPIRWWLNPDSPLGRRRGPARLRLRKPESRQGRQAQRLMNRRRVRTRYAGAWVLMDRVHDAADSGEILFRYLREHHPEINAWFVLEKGTQEWDRFKAAGHGDRLVAHDSLQWRLLMAHAAHLISSHADAAIVAPEPILEFTHAGWRYHFLNHGVIKDDLSAWLNPKEMETLVVSTRQEFASIAGDHTPYVFTSREVALTGMPRFDRMREVGLRYPPERRDLLLVAPTWRKNLISAVIPGTQKRIADPALLDTDFIRSWLGFLHDERLAAACAEHGVKLGYLPHPNLQPLLPLMDLPAHVHTLSYAGQDPQDLFGRARVLVTDFSSVAFNAAYLERPVVYYQFDAESVLGGGHTGRQDYFEYPRDGFGPVAETRGAAVDAAIQALEHGPRPLPEYQARIDATFTERDGRNCERLVAHIQQTEQNRSQLSPTPTPRPV